MPQWLTDFLTLLQNFFFSGPRTPPPPPRGRKQSAEEKDVIAYHNLYLRGLAVLFAAYLIVGMVFAIFVPKITIGESSANTGYLLWELGILHFIAGIRIVDANKIGGIFLLGWMTREVTATIVCVPPGIFWLITEDILTKEMEIPAEPENIWREEATPPKDRPEVRPPIRITFKEDPANKGDPLARRVTEEVSFFVRLRVEKFFNFYVRIGKMDEARHQLEDVGVSYLAEVLPQHTLSEAIMKVREFSDGPGALHDRLVKATRSWGVKVVTARVKQFPFSKSLNSAIQKMSESVALKREKITQGEAQEAYLTLEGKGKANAVNAELNARTAGMKKMSKELDTPAGRLVLGAEVGRLIGQSPSTKTIVGLPGFREILGIAGAVIDTSTTPPAAPPAPPALTRTPGGNP